jgi:hypothetical protein
MAIRMTMGAPAWAAVIEVREARALKRFRRAIERDEPIPK